MSKLLGKIDGRLERIASCMQECKNADTSNLGTNDAAFFLGMLKASLTINEQTLKALRVAVEGLEIIRQVSTDEGGDDAIEILAEITRIVGGE